MPRCTTTLIFFGLIDRTRAFLAVLLTLHTLLLAYSAYTHSPTFNEPGHLVAGVSHWDFGRFELYRVNPPLVRMVAALPVMTVGYEEDWSGFDESPGVRPVFWLGETFLAANGERSFFLFTLARWACIPFSWLGASICYLWARDLFGQRAGALSCALWCFSPNILGHASLITADAHATALGLAACYTFWRWLRLPSWGQAVLTGTVLGLAELAKTTLILFYPLWPLLWLAYRSADRKRMSRNTWLREGGMLALRMAVGMYVLNLGYGFEGSFRPLAKFHFTSELFTGASDDAPPIATNIASTNSANNRFVGTALGYLPVPFPKNYLLGIDIQQRDFEAYSRPSYLRGEWQQHGWWYYYLYGCAIKVPLGIWGLAGLSLFRRISGRCSGTDFRDEMILLAPAMVIFTVVSAKTGFNEHLRYVLPCFPFAFIWISSVVTVSSAPPSVVSENAATISTPFSLRIAWMSPLIAICSCWFILSSLWAYPHSLSYFNESIGGPINGYKHLVQSNIDWGQDLRYLRWWLDDHTEQQRNQPFHLAYFGYFNPGDVGFADALAWPTPGTEAPVEDAFAEETGLTTSQSGDEVYAISVTLLAGYPWSARSGKGSSGVLDPELLALLREVEPIGRAGYSIHIYDRAAIDAATTELIARRTQEGKPAK